MKFAIQELIKVAKETQIESSNGYVPARPDNFKYQSILARIGEAWLVLTGKADAVIWDLEVRND